MCNFSCVKYLLFVFNFLFWVCLNIIEIFFIIQFCLTYRFFIQLCYWFCFLRYAKEQLGKLSFLPYFLLIFCYNTNTIQLGGVALMGVSIYIRIDEDFEKAVEVAGINIYAGQFCLFLFRFQYLKNVNTKLAFFVILRIFQIFTFKVCEFNKQMLTLFLLLTKSRLLETLYITLLLIKLFYIPSTTKKLEHIQTI